MHSEERPTLLNRTKLFFSSSQMSQTTGGNKPLLNILHKSQKKKKSTQFLNYPLCYLTMQIFSGLCPRVWTYPPLKYLPPHKYNGVCKLLKMLKTLGERKSLSEVAAVTLLQKQGPCNSGYPNQGIGRRRRSQTD